VSLDLWPLARRLAVLVAYGSGHGLLLGERVHLLLRGDELLLPLGQHRSGLGPLGLQLGDPLAQAGGPSHRVSRRPDRVSARLTHMAC